MRKIANIQADGDYVRAMIYESAQGVFLFLYDTPDDVASTADEWYASVLDAESSCRRRFGLGASDWTVIDEPQAGCQHDWISPTRMKLDARES